MELTTTNTQVISKQSLIDDCIDEFISTLRRAETTKNVYRRVVRLFFSWCEGRGYAIDTLTDVHVNEYLTELEDGGRSVMTTNNYLTILRRFYRWTESRKYYPNIAQSIELRKTQQIFKKQPLKPNQVSQLMESVSSLRDYAMLYLMARTGLRCIEVVRADVKDITYIDGKRVLMVQGKGHTEKDDFVVLNDKTYEPLRVYLESRNASRTEPLFVSESDRNNGCRLTTRSVSRIAKAALVSIGLDNDCYTAHSLRHTVGTCVLRATGDLEMAQRTLRHSDSKITERYVHTLIQERRLQNSGEDAIDDLF